MYNLKTMITTDIPLCDIYDIVNDKHFKLHRLTCYVDDVKESWFERLKVKLEGLDEDVYVVCNKELNVIDSINLHYVQFASYEMIQLEEDNSENASKEYELSFNKFRKNDFDSIMTEHWLSKKLQLNIGYNECECIDLENTQIKSLTIGITNGFDTLLKLPKTIKELIIKSNKAFIDLANLEDCKCINSINIDGKFKMNGSMDLVIPSAKNITMNLQEESTIKFIGNSKMEKIEMKDKIGKVDLTGVEVKDLTIEGTIPLEMINTDKCIENLNVTTNKLTMNNSLNVRWLTINADIDKLDLTASDHILCILNLYSNARSTKLYMPKHFDNHWYFCKYIDIRANVEILDLTTIHCSFEKFTLITHAQSTQLLLPQLEDERIKKLINKRSIGYLNVFYIHLEGNILISDLCVRKSGYKGYRIEKIDVPMLKNLYVVSKEESSRYRMKIVEPLRNWYTNILWDGLEIGEINCNTYLVLNNKEYIYKYEYHIPKSKESTETSENKPKKKINKKLPQLNIHDDIDYNDYLDSESDYEDISDEYDSNENDDSQYSESYEEESDE